MADELTPKQVKTSKTAEDIRAERIAAVTDPKLRQELGELGVARGAKMAEAREHQRDTYDKRVAQLRDQKIRNINGPHLAPAGLRPHVYLGNDGFQRATRDAKAQIQTQDHNYLKGVAWEYNRQIEKKLDTYERDRAAGPAKEPRKVEKFELRSPDTMKWEITR